MIIINNRKRKTILITKFFNRTEREKKEMFELAKRFIEKECNLYTFDGNGYVGVIKEVTEGAVLLDRKDMSKCTIIAKQLCSRLLNGVQGRSPCKKDDVILRVRPQTILRPKDLVPPQFTRAARCLYEGI